MTMGSEPIQVSDIQIELPLFDKILSLNQKVKQHFPKDFDSGFAELGLILDQPSDWKNGGYWCTPLNTLSFGRTGMDGEHFSFLVGESKKITHQSPVIATLPCGTDAYNVVLAKNFTNFLRLGLHRGFFSLIDIGFSPKAALPLYLSDYSSTQNANAPMLSEALDDRRHKILDFVAEALALRPCTYTVTEFILLQQRYLPLLKMSADYDDPDVDV